MRWCEENTQNFVKLYLDKECLWNPAHKWYKAKYKRETAYAEIISEFETLTGKCMTIPEVKVKIKNLRSTYTQQVQKVLQKSSPDSIYKPSLIWFHEMDRCLKYVSNGRTATADLSQEINEVDSEQAIWSSQDKLLGVDSEQDAWSSQNKMPELDPDQAVWSSQDKLLANRLEDVNSDPLLSLPYTDNNDTSATQESLVQIKIKQDFSAACSNKLQKRKRKKLIKPHYFIRTQIENYTKEDEFDIYGKYIASQLRKMELQRALRVQFEIQHLMNEARISASED